MSVQPGQLWASADENPVTYYVTEVKDEEVSLVPVVVQNNSINRIGGYVKSSVKEMLGTWMPVPLPTCDHTPTWFERILAGPL